jgi:hypothetical protein
MAETRKVNLTRGLNRLALMAGLAWFVFCFVASKATRGANASEILWIGVIAPFVAYALVRMAVSAALWVLAGFKPASLLPESMDEGDDVRKV